MGYSWFFIMGAFCLGSSFGHWIGKDGAIPIFHWWVLGVISIIVGVVYLSLGVNP